MKMLKATLLFAAVLLAATASASVFAHGGGHRARLGVFIGAPVVFAPWHYYYPPPYYYPPAVVVRPSPPVYIEQGQEAPTAQRSESYWYYCPDSKAYYPYVDRCAGGWQRIVPQPPS